MSRVASSEYIYFGTVTTDDAIVGCDLKGPVPHLPLGVIVHEFTS